MNMMATSPGVNNVFNLPPSQFNSFIEEERQYLSLIHISEPTRPY